MSRKGITGSTLGVVALTVAAWAPAGSADATIHFPSPQAACIAQAWVPSNTDPAVPAGAIGAFLSSWPDKAGGGLRQNEC